MAEKTLVAQYDGVHVKVGNAWQRLALGAPVPSDADADHVKVLTDRGLVAEGETVGGIASDPDAPPPFPGIPEVAQVHSGGYDGASPPLKSGSKADWLDWAAKVEGVTVNSPEGEALAARTRDDLAAAYAKRVPAG